MNELYSHHPAMFKSNPLGFILALILVPVGVGILIFLYWFLMNKSSKRNWILTYDGGTLYHSYKLKSSRQNVPCAFFY